MTDSCYIMFLFEISLFVFKMEQTVDEFDETKVTHKHIEESTDNLFVL